MMSPTLDVEGGAAASLAPVERLCLAVLAVECSPCNRSQLAELLRDAGVRNPARPARRAKRISNGTAISTSDLAPMLERWIERGLAEHSADGRYKCTPEAAHHALSDPEVRGLIEGMRPALDEARTGFSLASRSAELLHLRLRAARLALYCGDPDAAERAFALAKQTPYLSETDRLHAGLLDPRSPVAALRLMSPALQTEYLAHVLPYCADRLLIPSIELLTAAAHIPTLKPMAATLAAMSGNTSEARLWLDGDELPLAHEARGVLALQRGDFAEARELAVAAVGASKAKRLGGPLAPLLTLALATGSPPHVALARSQLARMTRRGKVATGYVAIAVFLSESGAGGVQVDPATASPLNGRLQTLCLGLVAIFLDERAVSSIRGAVERLSTEFKAAGAHWLAAQADATTTRLRSPGEATPATPGQLTELYRPEAEWERALSQLEALQPPDSYDAAHTGSGPSTQTRRLVLMVRVSSYGRAADDGTDESTLSIEPRVQVRRGHTFTAGRAVALRTLAEPTTDLDYLTPEDLRVAARISVQRTWSGREYYFGPRAPLALVGHPRVFWSDQPDGRPVEVITRPPVLRAEHNSKGIVLRVIPAPNSAGISVMVDDEGRLVVTELSLPQLNVQRTIRELPAIPHEGEARLGQILGRMASLFTIHAPLGMHGMTGVVEELSTDSRPVVRLHRAEPGLRVRVSVQPLGAAGPSFKPGEGTAAVATELAGRRVRCQRDLDAERGALDALLDLAPSLRAAASGAALHIDTLPECLALLQALDSLADAVHVHWPEGAPLVVVAEADLSSLRLTLDARGEWLHATGSVRVDETQVLDMLSVLARRTSDGAYVALGDDRYLALGQELQAQLLALETVADTTPTATETGALRLPPIALGFVSPWLRQLRAAGGLKSDARTKKQLARIERAYASVPELPKTFEAQLRSYQVAGYEFLMRLAEIGAGACLADDMGLGKTLMTLALLVARADQGPALVVCPTSVRANWFDEALRFAPTLRMRRLDGAEAVAPEDLAAFDVLVCSFTVMTQRIDSLERTTFATLVIDEAQAIKNGTTQRARAARRLVADARVALTGTPIENHLGDLHGIMSFLNPGLLGDAKYFETRFGKPIQRERDEKAQQQLRALIGPFVLRRRKSEVLRELPPRTEITLRVEPDAEEQAFSEALRQAALVRLQHKGSERGSAISILAEITRLRRAACHPQLIDPNSQVGAAKLARLIELAHELREGGHRALVFSQFVDFLRVVGGKLTEQGFSYQYLDGSTPEAARIQSVAAFQAGQGDLFLISLKAGGFGLNLTAADYVIHLDPWWNPAVEAQASDRAHRIGQQRPVTIYRLVNAPSIEERVLALHERKRTIAEELLNDSAEATKLDPETLMALLRG